MTLLRRPGPAPVPGAVAVGEDSPEVLAELLVGGHRGGVVSGPDAVRLTSWDHRVLARADPHTRAEATTDHHQ